MLHCHCLPSAAHSCGSTSEMQQSLKANPLIPLQVRLPCRKMHLPRQPYKLRLAMRQCGQLHPVWMSTLRQRRMTCQIKCFANPRLPIQSALLRRRCMACSYSQTDIKQLDCGDFRDCSPVSWLLCLSLLFVIVLYSIFVYGCHIHHVDLLAFRQVLGSCVLSSSVSSDVGRLSCVHILTF